MKLHPNEFTALILKARGPWTKNHGPFLGGVPPLIFWLLSFGFATVTPKRMAAGLT